MSQKVEKQTFWMILWVYMLVGGGALGVDGGWMPLPTCPQQYCDPASLVFSMPDQNKVCDNLLKLFYTFADLIIADINKVYHRLDFL